MKKIAVASVLAFICGTSVYAAQVGESGIGIEFGGLNSNAKSYVNGVATDGDLSTTYEAIRFGKYLDIGRIGLSAGIMNKDKGTDGEFIGASYDYMFYNNNQLVPFIGASLSYSWNTANYDIKHNGWQYGVEAGAVYELNKELDIEVGARYLRSTVEGTKTVLGNNVKVEVDSVVQYYIAVGYKF